MHAAARAERTCLRFSALSAFSASRVCGKSRNCTHACAKQSTQQFAAMVAGRDEGVQSAFDIHARHQTRTANLQELGDIGEYIARGVIIDCGHVHGLHFCLNSAALSLSEQWTLHVSRVLSAIIHGWRKHVGTMPPLYRTSGTLQYMFSASRSENVLCIMPNHVTSSKSLSHAGIHRTIVSRFQTGLCAPSFLHFNDELTLVVVAPDPDSWRDLASDTVSLFGWLRLRIMISCCW